LVILLCALLLASSAIDPSSASGITHPVILEFLPNPEALMDQGEYVVIYNPAGQGIDISGFILTDLEGEFEIPGGTILDPELIRNRNIRSNFRQTGSSSVTVEMR